MIRPIVETHLEKVTTRYWAYVSAAFGQFSETIFVHNPMAPIVKNRYRQSIFELAHRAEKDIERMIEEGCDQIVRESVLAVEKEFGSTLGTPQPPERLSVFTASVRDHLQHTIGSRIQQDAADFMRRFDTFIVNVALKREDGTTLGNALVGEREAAMTGPGTVHMDKLHRRWASERHVQISASHGFYRAANLALMLALISRGETEAQVSRPGEVANEPVFSLFDYRDIEERHFHPGSKALISFISKR